MYPVAALVIRKNLTVGNLVLVPVRALVNLIDTKRGHFERDERVVSFLFMLFFFLWQWEFEFVALAVTCLG
jgi:hypothetical protein